MRGPDIERESARAPANHRTRRELGAFFAAVFVVTWGLGALIIFARPQLEALIGPIGIVNQHWLYFIAVSAPTMCAAVIAAVSGRMAGLRELLMSLLRPAQLKWWAVAIFAYPVGLLVYGLLERALGARNDVDMHALLITAPTMAVTTLVLFSDPGALGEELGWRGFALPRLLRLCNGATAAIVLGVLWATWHVPAFLVEGLSQATFNFGWFLLGLVSLSVLMTWIFVHANGSALVAGVLPHAILNLTFDAHVFKVVPKTQAIVLAIIAALILAVFGPSLRGWQVSAPHPRRDLPNQGAA